MKKDMWKNVVKKGWNCRCFIKSKPTINISVAMWIVWVDNLRKNLN